jgi:hypothetical protein
MLLVSTFRDLDWGFFRSFLSLLSGEVQRACIARGSSRGALNAGRAWICSLAGAGHVWNVADIWLSGLKLECRLRSFLMLASGEVPRAVRRADYAGAPSMPGRLGYLMAERLMDLGKQASPRGLDLGVLP